MKIDAVQPHTKLAEQLGDGDNLGEKADVDFDPSPADNLAKDRAGRQALNQLMAPVAPVLWTGRILASLSAVLSIAPYVALINLGEILLAAAQHTAPDRAKVIWWLNLLVMTFVTRLFLYFFALAITHFADNRLRAHIRNQLLEKIGSAPLSWFTATNSGRVRKAIQDDAHQLHMLVAHGPVEVTHAAVMPIALLVCAFLVDWRLGLLAIATLPFFVLLNIFMMRGMGEKTAELDTRMDKLSATMVEFVTGISVVKAFGKVGVAHKRYSEAAKEFSEFYIAWCEPLLKGSALAFSTISTAILLLVNLGGGALMVNAGWVTPVQVVCTSLIALVLPSSLVVVSSGTWAYQLAGGAALRIRETLATPQLVEPAEPQKPDGNVIRFTDVHFSYGQTKAVDGVTLELAEDTVTALIGPSGSGKSTLATLVARFADPDAGSITLGGVDVRHIATADLYQRVAFVLQDAQLLRASIRDNIRLGRPDATDQEIQRAARAAHIADFIEALPHGYDTIVGEDTKLSGGQEQRISIARALLIDAPILILDEATAMTDPDSEAEIQAALTRLVQGRTVLVIAHRLASIKGADTIVVLDRGRIVAQGTAAELANEPHYQALEYACHGSSCPSATRQHLTDATIKNQEN